MSTRRVIISPSLGYPNINGTYRIVRNNETYELTNPITPTGYSITGRTSPYHVGNVNVVIAGIIFSGLILALIIVCFWHRNTRKPSSTTLSERSCSQYWEEPTVVPGIDLLTVSSREQYFPHGLLLNDPDQCHCQLANRILTTQLTEPPPSYDTVIKLPVEHENYSMQQNETINESHIIGKRTFRQNTNTATNSVQNLPSDETGLPSYEAALRLESGNYL